MSSGFQDRRVCQFRHARVVHYRGRRNVEGGVGAVGTDTRPHHPFPTCRGPVAVTLKIEDEWKAAMAKMLRTTVRLPEAAKAKPRKKKKG